MKIGNLANILNDEQNIFESINAGSFGEKHKKPSKISKILTSLSKYGMNYDDDVYNNMMAIPGDKLLQKSMENQLDQSLYGMSYNNWKIKPEEDKSFSEKTLAQRREVLRKIAMQPELEDILDIMANEAVVYDDDESYICKPFIDTGLIQDLNEKSADEIRNAIDTAFYKIYMLLDWKHNAWNQFRRFLVDGVLSFEIVYDNIENPKSIIGIIDIDPVTLTKKVEGGITYWIQYKDIIGKERKLLDSQIIYIKYEDSGVSVRQSYLERLIRPFNLYRIVEQAQVIWTVTQSSFKTMFTIPVAGMPKAKGHQTLTQAMNRYKEEITFNQETGELQVNGRTNMPFNKEYWMPENDHGTPTIETLVDNGPQLNDSDQIKYFESKLYKASKIPESRFDKDAQSTWFGTDPTSALREEITFTRFVNRLRNVFGEILLKPIRIQLTLSVPDIKNDKRILMSTSIRFNSYNLFEEMMNIEVDTKRIEFIGTIKDSITEIDEEGEEKPYFASKFLIQKYLKMSDADIELNEKYKLEEKLAKKNKKDDSEDEEDDNSDEELGGDEENNEEPEENPEEDESGDIDSEMLGPVQPESPETTQA